MTRPYVPDNHDLPDFGPDDDPNHDTQDGRWIGVLFIGALLGVAAFIGIVIGALT